MVSTADRALARVLILIASATIISGCGGVDVTQSDGTANSATASSNSSGAATIALSESNYEALPASTLVVTIYRSGSSTGSVSVSYATVDGTAAAGTDYTATRGSVTWPDGDDSPRSVEVPVTADASGKGFNFALTDVSGSAAFGSPATATITVPNASSTTNAVTLSWLAPTENTDGTALTNLAGFHIYYGTSESNLTEEISIGTIGQLTCVIDELSSGTWYFEVVAVNSSGNQSGPSTTVSATI
ncbi:MAG: Calx-beta domain-containing protein [Steroidobacteraceae bacterium]